MADKKKDKDKKKGKAEEAVTDTDIDTEAPASEDNEGGEGAPEEQLDLDGKKKGIKPILIIVGALVLLIAAGAGVYFSGLLDPLLGKGAETAEAGHGGEAKKDAKSGGHGGGHGGEGEEGAAGEAFMELPDLIVNLSSNQGPQRYLKLKVQLELKNPGDKAGIEAVAPRVIDHFQTYLRELRVSDLRGSAGIYRLRQELLARVNEAAKPIEVKDVLFQEILIQ